MLFCLDADSASLISESAKSSVALIASLWHTKSMTQTDNLPKQKQQHVQHYRAYHYFCCPNTHIFHGAASRS